MFLTYFGYLQSNLAIANFAGIRCHALSHCIYEYLIEILCFFNQIFLFGAFLAYKQHSSANQGITASTGILETQVGPDTHQDSGVKYINT